MKLHSILGTVAAAAMVLAPAVASAQAASSATVKLGKTISSRTAAASKKENKIGGIGAALIGVTIIVGGIAAGGAFDGNSNSSTDNGSGL